MPDEQRLFYTIMTGYEKAVRPSKKATDAITVKLGLSLTQIMDIVRNFSEVYMSVRYSSFLSLG
jgi:hypothetical protein